MAASTEQNLRQKASNAMRAGDYRGALEIYRQLERRMPRDPTWPERCAAAYHEIGGRRDELACLRKALDLQVDHGEVLAAIALCKQILDIEPKHTATLDCLHLLYTEPILNPGDHVAQLRDENSQGGDASEDTLIEPEEVLQPARDAPLDELVLTDAIPGARPMRIGDGEMGSVNEIPLDLIDELPPPDVEAELSLDDVAPAQRTVVPEIEVPPPARPDVTQIQSTSARDELASIPLFGSLDAATLRQVMENMRVVRLLPGDVLFREGEPANTLYVVVDGAVVPIAEGPPRQRLAVIEAGEFFGEIGLVTNQPRNATIEALVETKLLAVDRRTMWSIIRGRSETSKLVLRFLRQRLIDRHVRTHPLFSAFGSKQRGELAGEFHFLEVADGATLIEQGRRCEGLFVLLAGCLDVVDKDSEKQLGNLEAGDLCGAVALVQGEPAAASVVANGKCWVLVMNEARFQTVIAGNPDIEGQLAAIAEHSRMDQLAI